MADWGVARWIAGKIFGLPPRQTRRVGVEHDLPVAMPDGSILLAERGFVAVVQCVRGTMGSGGVFDPLRQERYDGAATIDWLRAQPWFKGPLFTFGSSYLGTVQWAMADVAGDRLDGMGTAMTLSNFRDHILHGGGFYQAFTLGWVELMRQMTDPGPGRKMRRPKEGSLDPVHGCLPVGTLDVAAFGTDGPLATATDLMATRQEVFHNDNHASALRLTIVEARGADGKPVTENTR